MIRFSTLYLVRSSSSELSFCRCVSTLPQSIWWLCLFLRSEYGGILPQIRPSGCLPCCRLCRDRRKYSWCPANHSWAGVALWCFQSVVAIERVIVVEHFIDVVTFFGRIYASRLATVLSSLDLSISFNISGPCGLFLSGYRCNCSWMGWLRRCHCPDFPG